MVLNGQGLTVSAIQADCDAHAQKEDQAIVIHGRLVLQTQF